MRRFYQSVLAIVALFGAPVGAHEPSAVSDPDTLFDCDLYPNDRDACIARAHSRAEARQAYYLRVAMIRYADRSELTEIIGRSDALFAAYRKAECDAVYEHWKDGSIRNWMYSSCAIELTDRRTHDIWRNWLTYADSTPPMLPEPEPTR